MRTVPSLDSVEITSKIDDLLQKSNQLQAQMNNLQSNSQSAATISSGEFLGFWFVGQSVHDFNDQSYAENSEKKNLILELWTFQN